MNNTLFIASFPDLNSFDFSKTDIKVGEIDCSNYYFNKDSSYNDDLKKLIGTCDVIFVPPTDSMISFLEKENIKCIVLYPNIACKETFINSMKDSGVDPFFIDSIENSWDYIISRLDKHDYKYKFVMGEDDNMFDVLRLLLSKRDLLGCKSLVVNDEVVNDIFNYCLLDDVSDSKDDTYCEGIKFNYYFSHKKIEEKKEDISNIINSIKEIEDGISVKDMATLKDGTKWTDSMLSLEKLMVLGISSGALVYPFSRDLDSSLKGEVPYVIKCKSLNKGTII